MKRTIEGFGKIEIDDGFVYINDQPLHNILEDNGLKYLNICGTIRIEIYGKEPGIKVEGGTTNIVPSTVSGGESEKST